MTNPKGTAGPLAKRSITASRLDFGTGKGKISNNLRRLARGQRALLCASILRETGKVRSSKRCATIAHAEALNSGNALAAKGIETQFNLSGPGVEKRVKAALELNRSKGNFQNMCEIAYEYGTGEEYRALLVRSLAAEMITLIDSPDALEAEVDIYRQMRGLTPDGVEEAKTLVVAQMIMQNGGIKRILPSSLTPSEENITKAAELAAVMALVEFRARDNGLARADHILQQFEIASAWEDVLEKALAELQEQGNYVRAYYLASYFETPPVEFLRKAALQSIRLGRYTREMLGSDGDPELDELRELSEVVGEIEHRLRLRD